MPFSKCLIKHTVPETHCTTAGAYCEKSSVCIYTHRGKHIFVHLYSFSSSYIKVQMHDVHIDTNSLVREEKTSETNHIICSGELAKLL